MKYFAIIILSLVAFSSCDRNKPTPSPSVNNTASITINGNSWAINSVRGHNYNDSVISFTLELLKKNTVNENYIYEDFVVFLNKSQNIQIFKLGVHPTISFYIFIEEGDVAGDSYTIASESENNWMQITKQNDNYRTIQGKFNATLVKVNSGVDPSRYPDTIQITNGEFNITLE